MPNKRGYKKRGSALKSSPPATSPRRTKTPAPTQTLTPVRRVGRPPSKLRSPASPVQRSSLPTVSPKPGEKLQQSCNHTQQLWSDVNCGTAAAEATKPRQMHDSPEHSTSLHDSSDQEINIQDHIYRPQSQHSVSEDDAIHANPTPTAAMPPDSHPQEDTNNSQNRPKKLSKREVKALLKQPKRARTILDESVVAEMDQLATRFEVDCKINVAGVIRRPIPVAEPIDSNTSPLSAPSVPVSPPAPSVVRGGRGRGRGRRGSAAAASLRRGGGKAGSFASLTPAPTRTPRTASWSPLCLPARASYEAPPHKSPAPRLKFLSASCVKNFLAKVESILSRSHSQQSRLLPTHSLDANGFDFSHKQEPAPLTTYPSLPPTAPAAEQSYYQHQQQKPAYHHHHHHHHHHNEMPEEQHPMRKAEAYPSNYAPHSPPPPQPPPSTAPVVPGPPDSLQVGETSSAVSIVRHVRIGRPPKRGGQRRGRGRPRILNLPSDDALRAAVAEAGAESERAKWHQYEGVDQPRSYHPGGDSGDLRGASPQKPPSPATEAIPTGGASGAPDCLTMQHLAKPGKPGRPRGSIGARRELRGLVTWAAMMAAEEQAAQQKQHRRHSSLEEDADSSFSAEPARKPTGLSPLSLQIVGMEDDLTATAADGSGLSDPSRTTRRTRRASLGTASGGSSVGATRGGHVSGRRASETGSSVSVVDAGDQSLKDGLQPNASSWTSDQADTSSLLPFSPSPLHVAASDATMDSAGPERQQNNSASNGEVGLPTNASEEDQAQPPVRPLHRGRGGGGGGGRGRKRKYRGIGRPSEHTTPPSPPPPTPSQSDLSMPTAFPPFAAGNGASSDDNNDDKCVSGSPLKSTAADDEDSSSSGARRLDPAASGGGSGGPILPPRKRYKANVDSADEQRPSTSPQPTSRSPLSPSMDGGDLSSPSPPSNPAHPNLSDLCGGYLAPVGSAGVRSSLESDSSPFGVRGGTRGRGGLRGRRKGRGGRRSLHQPFETHQDAKAAADNAATSVVDTTPSRPKREAAALGFASLVASSLNSSPIQYDQSESSIKPSQQTPVDHHHQNSPSLTTSETVDPATTPTTPVGTTLASVRTSSQKSWRGGGTPPVGRGRGLRGRPPKRPIAATPTVLFPPPLLAATASAAATAAADGTMQTKMDSSFSSETSATTATSISDSPPAQSATTPTAAAAAVTDAPVNAPSEAEPPAAGVLPTPPVSTEASVVTGEGLPVLTGKRKIGGGGKRGRRPTAASQVSSPPTKRRAVEDTAPLPPSSVNGSSATAPTTKTPPPPPPASSASGFGTDELNHACRDLRLFLLRTHARSEHRLRRDRERRSKATANVHDTVGSTKRLLTGTVERLPSRNLIFPFGSLTRKLLDESEEKAGLNADLVPTGGVQALLASLLDRLLNHPDLEPNGTGARLVAPLLSTPDPLRHPDFYRYACSTGALASLETALGLPKGTGHSLQADILLTVSPCYCFTNGYAGQRSVPAPFQHLSPEYPPICLRSLLHSVLNGELLLTSDAESSPSATTATAFQRLDLAFDLLMRLWEAYAGRRSWLGRRLLQIRGAYTRLRTEQTAEDSSIPLPHLTPGSASAANKIQGASPGGGPLKKKVDRRTLERGAEVIRCLCGFRVEAGHVMVQCDCCTTWQHLPCVWWALSICLEPSLAAPRSTSASQLANWLPHQPPHDPGFEPEEGAAAAADSAGRRARCRAALLAALQTGGISLPAHSGGGNCGSAGSTTAPDCAYFCPTCLELDGLTKDYPRTLAVALAQNDVAKVFPETAPESTAGVTYEYWSLASPDGGDQLLTDEFALVHRDDFQHAVERGSAVAATAAGTTTEREEETNELRLASDVVVLRIYRLWKDSSGKSWMEGGAFLRPYDLLKGAPPQTTALVNSQLWHARELVYDEASRVVLPLSAWRGRCSVLSPTVYRQGRLMDLPALILPSSTAEVEETDAHPLVFLCDRLFNRGEGDSLSFQEIAPAYLKVNMKPYAFLRHTESSALRAAIVRQLRAEDLRTLDSSTAFGAVLSVNLDGLYSQSRERRQKGRPLSPRRTHELVFSLSEKITLDAALGRLSSQSRKQHATSTDSQLFTHTNRKSCLPAKLGDSTIGHPNLPTGASEALSLSAGPTPELSSTSALLLTEGTEPTTPATIHATADSAVIPSAKRSGKSKAGSGKIRDQDLLKDAKTLTFSELREKIAAQEGLSAKTAAPSPRRKVVGKQHTVSAVKSSLKHTSAAAAAAPTDSTPQPDLGPPKSPLFVETTTPTVTDLTKKPQFSPISPATSPLSPDPTSSAIAIITDTIQQQRQQQRLPENHKSPPPSSQASEDLHPTAPSTVVEVTFPGVPRLLSSSEQIEPDKPTEETVSELSDVELSSKAATGSTVIATATETACHNTASSEVMLATPSRLNPIPLKVNQALVMVSSNEEENFETCDELFPIPEPQVVAIQEEENDDFAEDGDVQSSCVHLSAGVTLSTTESVSLVTCAPVISHRAEASRIPCGVKTLESSPQLEMLEGLDATEVNEEFAQWTVCSPAGADSHLNPFSTVCEMVLNSPFSTTAVAPMSLSGVPSPAEATSTVVTSLSDFITESADAIVYTCPLASLVAPGCRVSPPNGQQNQPLRPLISPALTYQPISPDSSDESPRRTHASVQPPPQSEIPNAVDDDSVQSDGNRLSTTAATEEEKRQRHSVSRSSPSGVWSPAQSRDHRDRRRHSHHRYHHHHHRDRDHHRRSSSNRSRSNSEHHQPSEHHHQHRHYHHRQHRHSDCSSVDSEQRERQRSRSQSDHRHSRHERYPEAKDASASVAAAENASRPNSHHRRRKGHSPKRIVFRRYEDGTSATATRDSAVTAPVPQEGVLDLSTSSSSTLAPESNGGEVSSGGSSNN